MLANWVKKHKAYRKNLKQLTALSDAQVSKLEQLPGWKWTVARP